MDSGITLWEACEKLDTSRTTLSKRLKKLGVEPIINWNERILPIEDYEKLSTHANKIRKRHNNATWSWWSKSINKTLNDWIQSSNESSNSANQWKGANNADSEANKETYSKWIQSSNESLNGYDELISELKDQINKKDQELNETRQLAFKQSSQIWFRQGRASVLEEEVKLLKSSDDTQNTNDDAVVKEKKGFFSIFSRKKS